VPEKERTQVINIGGLEIYFMAGPRHALIIQKDTGWVSVRVTMGERCGCAIAHFIVVDTSCLTSSTY